MKKIFYLSFLLIIPVLFINICSASPIIQINSTKNIQVPEKNSKLNRIVKLVWEPSKEPGIIGYKLYYSTSPGQPDSLDPSDYALEGASPVIIRHPEHQITLHGLSEDKDYFFTITAFGNKNKGESDYSQELQSKPFDITKIDTAEAEDKDVKDVKEESVNEDEHSAEESAGVPVSETSGKIKVNSKLSEKTIEEPGVGEKISRILPAAKELTEKQLDEVVSPGDSILITVEAQQQLDNVFDVAPNGHIYFHTAGAIKVTGLSVRKLRELLKDKLMVFFNIAEVPGVEIVAQKRFLQVNGGVRYPGWYRFPKEISFQDVLLRVGGVLKGVDKEKITLKRKVDGKYIKIPITPELELTSSDLMSVPVPSAVELKVDNGDLLHLSIPSEHVSG
jgi:protein involved in polysaccharide export with SLBB domain